MNTTMTTFTGIEFNFQTPDPSTINITDIAHSLCSEPIFLGRTKEFYSVAQHSIMVANLVEPEFGLEGLLHNAYQAYCKNIPQELLNMFDSLTIKTQYLGLCNQINMAIIKKFEIPENPSIPVIKANEYATICEKIALTSEKIDNPYPFLIPIKKCMTPRTAEIEFIKLYKQLIRLKKPRKPTL